MKYTNSMTPKLITQTDRTNERSDRVKWLDQYNNSSAISTAKAEPGWVLYVGLYTE